MALGFAIKISEIHSKLKKNILRETYIDLLIKTGIRGTIFSSQE